MSAQQFWLSCWNWNPVVIAACGLALLAYARAGQFRMSARAGCFCLAVITFFLTLVSPVNALAEGYLFSAHMLQHLLLLLVIPPLLLLGLPKWEKITSKIRLHPMLAWLAGVGAMWFWHERTLCDFATSTPTGRVLQIVSLLLLGLIFWWPIAGPRLCDRLAPLLGVLYLFSACVGCTILGILITFAPAGAVCPVFMNPVDRLGIMPVIRGQWGITPAVDEQIGGLMMWVPGCGIYLLAIMTLLIKWYQEPKLNAPATAKEVLAPGLSPANTAKENA